MAQTENGWISQPPEEIKDDETPAEHSDSDQPIFATAVASEAETTPVLTNDEATNRRHSSDSSINSVQYSESYRLQTFIANQKPESFGSRRPTILADISNSTCDPGDTLVSGITFKSSEKFDLHSELLDSERHRTLTHPKSVLFVTPFNDSSSSFSSSGSVISEISAIDVAQLSADSEEDQEPAHAEILTSGVTAIDSPEIAQALGPHSTSSTANDTSSTHGITEESQALSSLQAKNGPAVRQQRPLISLNSLPPQFTLRSSNQSTFASQSYSTPFRIPTLALVRLLLYPLIPIFSFTLMCVVRWVWFRSAMPSRWEILNVVSGFLRAMEGLLCLLVFLLNPALNRSFREIRKRNTPV
ncbi:hypothetical protein GGF41_007603, partial [Coemansia sp. RSA 2531]